LRFKDAGDAADTNAIPGALIALALLIAGAVGTQLPAVYGLPLFGYASIALLLAGGVARCRSCAHLLAPLQRFPSRFPRILPRSISGRAPRKRPLPCCGIVATPGLTIAMAVMVSSFPRFGR